jgi:biotin transport system substrate-specific component
MNTARSRAMVLTHGDTLLDDVALVVAGSLLMALCAHISIPLVFSPVPLTLQTFGILLIALTLGAKRGAVAMALYLVEGASGLPVFSPAGPGGIAQLIGPTGGFLMSYPLAAFVIGKLFENRKTVGMAQIASLAGVAIFMTSGMLWLSLSSHVSLGAAFTMAVLPFIPGEIIKIIVASYSGTRTSVWLTRLLG